MASWLSSGTQTGELSLLQRVKLSQAVSSRMTGLELDEKFKCGLIWMLFKALCHLLPMVLEDIGTSTARFVAAPTIGFWPNDDAACASVLAPAIDASEERFVLLAGKSPWKLDAQLFEELHGVDVGELLPIGGTRSATPCAAPGCGRWPGSA